MKSLLIGGAIVAGVAAIFMFSQWNGHEPASYSHAATDVPPQSSAKLVEHDTVELHTTHVYRERIEHGQLKQPTTAKFGAYETKNVYGQIWIGKHGENVAWLFIRPSGYQLVLTTTGRATLEAADIPAADIYDQYK